jgi:tripartite-type tricarboxylate transporter receptor subunit TctC
MIRKPMRPIAARRQVSPGDRLAFDVEYTSTTTKRLFLSLAGAAGLASVLPAMPQPARSQIVRNPARMLVGFTPGGSSLDAVARLVINEMKDYCSSSFIVENRPGAGGRVALEALKRSATDGSVMILTPAGAIVLYPHVDKVLGYDALKDFAPVTTVCDYPLLLTVGPRVPAAVKTLADFIAWCRANPTEASYATAGAGSMLHFTGMMLGRAAGFEFVHVPYGAGGNFVQHVLGGQIASCIFGIGPVVAYVQAGSLRALATTGQQRSPFLPDVPTVRELGYPQLEATEWFGVLVPAKTPAEIVNSLNSAIREALKADAVKTGMAQFAYEAAPTSPSEFAKLIKSDFDRWGSVVKAFPF